MVPTQPRFYRHRYFHGIDHGPGNFQHQRDIPQHTGSGAFAGYLFYRTAEVYIQYVGISLLATTSRIDHSIDKTSVNLYGDRPLRILYAQFPHGTVDIPYQSIARHELRVDHIGSEFLTHQTERLVRDIFHRSQ